MSHAINLIHFIFWTFHWLIKEKQQANLVLVHEKTRILSLLILDLFVSFKLRLGTNISVKPQQNESSEWLYD